ncbi:uncharacterized protein LOC113676352 [Pocillopora damicornis]|uniref:uncharacterized protein LOC113676352 n=1 Tax=Pocillopora damicornis TaxID=46731 RepID=UPI000F54F602|nr:uncharacterized protein LOC113676352 [Pocillopora damicornis]
MENPQNTKRGSSPQTPARLIYFCVFLSIVVCLSFVLSVYSFKRVLSLDKEFHSRTELKAKEEEQVASSDRNVAEGKEVDKYGSRKHRSQLPGERQSLIPESILLYGNGKRYALQKTDVVTQWTKANKNGNKIAYRSSVGRVEVMRDGLYFIYSQMCFSGNRNQDTAGHRIFINHEEKMTTVIGRQDTTVACRYHGGAFYLRAHDTIAVKPTATGQYYMSAKGSFLGVFLI